MTIDLKKAKPGEEFTIKISEDVQAVGAKVSDLVTKINGVLSFIKQQNTMDEKLTLLEHLVETSCFSLSSREFIVLFLKMS